MRHKVKAVKPGAGVVTLEIEAPDAAEAGRLAQAQGCVVLSVSGGPVSYTHLTLPTKA